MKKIQLKKIVPLGFLLIANVVHAQLTKHVVLISIDGLRPEMYQDTNWATPNLKEAMKAGTYAKYMKSVFPSYTYPSHVAMLTGAFPSTSGICYNAPLGSTGDWNWFTKDIKVPTLWQILKKAGLTTSAVEWPVSAGTEITYDIPEIWNNNNPGDRITEVRKYATKGLIEEIETNATGNLNGSNMTEDNFSLDANSSKIAGYIFKTYKPVFLAVHFAEVDGFQHEYGLYGDSVKFAVSAVDKAVGELVKAVNQSGLKDSTTIIIVGDHGFSDIHQAIFPNKWLKDRGLTGYFQPAGGSAFLYLKDIDNKALLENIRTAITELPDSTKKLFRVIEKPELIKMGADKEAVMALAAIPGIIFGGGTQVLTKPVTGGHHGYDPDLPEMYTGFIAFGRGINTERSIRQLCVTDIAPLIAKLLGVEFETPDGKLPAGILSDK